MRSARIPKQTWRDPSCIRTLAPLDCGPTISHAWKSHQIEITGQCTIAIDLHPDGSPSHAPAIQPVRGSHPVFIGVFAVSFVSPEDAKITLREEECARILGVPRRPTRHIARLRPWKPVRILLNGRSANNSGQYYQIREYHFTLCTGSAPERIEPAQFLDLQADLI